MKNRKTFSHNRTFIASALAAMMTLTCGTAYADSNVDTTVAISESAELTDIGGFACYQRDGNYWTMLDGEEYLVIDFRDILPTNNFISTTNTQEPDSKSLSSWENKAYIPLSPETSYKTQIDLSNGDYYSPIFELSHFSNGTYNGYIQLSTNHIVNNSYDIEIYVRYQNMTDWFMDGTRHLTFNIFGKTQAILIGGASFDVDCVGLKFLSSSTGRDDFECTFTQYKP